MRTLIFSTLFLLGTGLSVVAQDVTPDVVASAGGSGVAESVTIMWTVGEVAVTTITSGDVWVTQGFHQPPPGVTSTPRIVHGGEGIDLFPNPSSGSTQLVLTETPRSSWQVEVLDLLGQVVLSEMKSAGSDRHAIDLSSLASGSYLLRVRTGSATRTRPLILQR